MAIIYFRKNKTFANIVYTPFLIVTPFADHESTSPRNTIISKPAPINGAYTDRWQLLIYIIMKNTFLLLLTFMAFACGKESKQSNVTDPVSNKLNNESELELIEETRTKFQLAIKEKRYDDLSKYATSDIISVTPDCGDWAEYNQLIKQPLGLFSYDSLRMKPLETVIVSDSVAYDFGTSSVYYTDENGELVEITDTFLAIIKKDKTDGVWKLHREVATSNVQ